MKDFPMEEKQKLRRAVLNQLESLNLAGVTHIPAETVQVKKMATEITSGSDRDEGAITMTNLPEDLAIIANEVCECTLCDELATTRTQTVFGVGNPEARLCFLGEAPGADEDRQGEPFVGRAGKLLDDVITNGMGMARTDVYILNILKCRPPGNRNPLPNEVQNCRSFLDRQLAAIQPEFICCLGAVAAQNLLETSTPIGKLRGQLHTYNEIAVVCTYHPAYLLRNPAAKKDTWKDIQFLMSSMGISRPAKKK